MKNILKLTILPIAIMAVSACTHKEVNTLPAPGKYEKTTKTTNSDGTDTSVTKKAVVSEDRYGNRSATVKTETTRDPEGLFNKSKTTSTTTVR